MTGDLRSLDRLLIVAIDHPLYSWPCAGLEDRAAVISAAVSGGADAFIAGYGTIRDLRGRFGPAIPILKLDLTTVTVGGDYPVSRYQVAWTVEDALRLGAGAVLTFVQLGADHELEALRAAGRVAAQADQAGLAYLCEIMPVESERFREPDSPLAVAAAARTGAELGAHLIKTSMPDPIGGVAVVAGACDAPLILAGGAVASDVESLLGRVVAALDGGARGVAFGRNVWAVDEPETIVRRLRTLLDESV